jgi:DNA-binding ferritin-like protein (Dps family)
MDRCYATESLSNYLFKVESAERVGEAFMKKYEEKLMDIEAELQAMREDAKEFAGYDLSEFCEELIKDSL